MNDRISAADVVRFVFAIVVVVAAACVGGGQ